MVKKKRGFIMVLASIIIAIMVGSVWAAETTKLNIKTATIDQLTQLQQIGPSYAARIVEYREKNGPFQRIEELMNVPGIGQRTFELNKDLIRVK